MKKIPKTISAIFLTFCFGSSFAQSAHKVKHHSQQKVSKQSKDSTAKKATTSKNRGPIEMQQQVTKDKQKATSRIADSLNNAIRQ
jgi:hypothetical protein